MSRVRHRSRLHPERPTPIYAFWALLVQHLCYLGPLPRNCIPPKRYLSRASQSQCRRIAGDAERVQSTQTHLLLIVIYAAMASAPRLAQPAHHSAHKEHTMPTLLRRTLCPAKIGSRRRQTPRRRDQRSPKAFLVAIRPARASAVGLLAVWSYARRHRQALETRAPIEKIRRPCRSDFERPASPKPRFQCLPRSSSEPYSRQR